RREAALQQVHDGQEQRRGKCVPGEPLPRVALVWLEVRITGQGPFTNDYFAGAEPGADKHYVTLFVLAESAAGEPQRLEPHKCDAWEWFTWDALPTPLFLPIVHLLEGGFTPPPPREGAV
ncbi:MAG: hypothetical protein ACK5HM_18815, partial [Gemmatimonas sp.]